MSAPEGKRRAFRRGPRVPRWTMAIVLVAGSIVALTLLFGMTVLQATIAGIALGGIYVLGASGLSLTYGVKKFANFAHGDLMTVGAYVAFQFNVVWGQSILLGVVGAMLAVAGLGMFLELTIFRWLEGRGEVPPLIASVGVALVLENVVALIYGGNPLYLNVVIPTDVPIGATGLSFNWIRQGAMIIVAVGLIVFLHVLLRYTTLGKAMRACADNLELARASGINTRHVILWTWAISGGLAGIAGVLLGILVNVFPLLGFFVLLFIFAAVIIGGIGSPSGALIGGFIVGLIQRVSDAPLLAAQQAHWLQGGVAYEPAIAFLTMIIVLLVLPDGIMGGRRPGRGRRSWMRFARRRPKEAV